jgi:UDP-N-acetylmuramate dehydrogenase
MQQNLDLRQFNTFGLPARARWFCVVDTIVTLETALQFAREHALPVLVLGGGSNVLLREDFPGLVLHMQLRGVQVLDDDGDTVRVQVACGENWHEFVSTCLARGWHGLENLALIPGSVGAAPIQNIGAYGVEAGERIESVLVWNRDTACVEQIAAADCGFGYRDSVFKRQYRDSRIILQVVFRLQRRAAVNLSYSALAQALAGQQPVTPQAVFAAVCRIRRSRLPDPAELGNAGSFFKNPLVGAALYRDLQQRFGTVPGHAIEDALESLIKIPAAWLIERAGWKGRRLGQAGVYDKQALVLVNLGGAKAQEIVDLALAIMADVQLQFGIMLEPEVQWVPPVPFDSAGSPLATGAF